MHVVGATSAFDVSFRHLNRFASWRRATLARHLLGRLHVAVRLLGLAAQGLLFATAMWLMAAAPGFLFAQ